MQLAEHWPGLPSGELTATAWQAGLIVPEAYTIQCSQMQTLSLLNLTRYHTVRPWW